MTTFVDKPQSLGPYPTTLDGTQIQKKEHRGEGLSSSLILRRG